MDNPTQRLLAAQDWPATTPGLLDHADRLIRRYSWRGAWAGRPTDDEEALADGLSAHDFLDEAISRLLQGSRTLNSELELVANLKRIISSLVWSWKKRSDRKPLRDISLLAPPDELGLEPLEKVADEQSYGVTAVEKAERLGAQRELLKGFCDSIASDKELAELLEAYRAEYYKPREIAEITGIPAERVSELKRKLQDRFERFARSHPAVHALGWNEIFANVH